MNICLDGNGIGNGFGVYILKGKMVRQVLMVGLTRKNCSKDYYGDTKDRTGNRFYELGTGGSNKTDEFSEKFQGG